jgi:hypothetical protein
MKTLSRYLEETLSASIALWLVLSCLVVGW